MTAAPPPFKALIAAGGTGGHLFPAVAVAEQCADTLQGNCIIEFIGTADRIEASVVPGLGYTLHHLPIAGLQKLLSLSTLQLPLKIVRSIHKARGVLQELNPHCVICAGAYLSYPVGIAAAQMNIPLFLMESNAMPGKTIVRLASKARKIYTTFEESRGYFPSSVQSRIEVMGNPVRAQLHSLPDRTDARAMFHLAADKPTVFIFGGSLGAQSINAAVHGALSKFRTAGIQILWQTGKHFTPMTNTDGVAEVLPFIDNMAAAYSAADVVVCRAGATTLAELALVRKPAILVPFPHAANDHQTANALALQQQGAAILLNDADVYERLFDAVRGVLENPAAQAAMVRSLELFANPDAARNIANAILSEVYREFVFE